MMAAGNEPAGDWVTYCNDWVQQMKAYDPTKIYCGASVGGGWAWDDGSEYHVKGGARGLDWDKKAPSSDDDYYSQIEYPRNYKPVSVSSVGSAAAVPQPNNTPIIAHEQGQWCAFPDLKEISQYTGVYKAGNFEIFRDLLHDNGMESMAENFLMASGRLQTLCYKYEIERNLRTLDYAGFQLLALNDYSGQGTALVGPLNVHWREKGYVDQSEWREFCNFLVPLARFPKFVYTKSDTLRVPVDVYNAYKTKVNEVKGVILHHTAEPTVQKALETLTSVKRGVGTHVVIDTDGTRYIMCEPELVTFHAGKSVLNGREACNDFTIGIEFQGNTLERPLTDDQIKSAIEYLRPLIAKYEIPIQNIVTHEMVRQAYKRKYPHQRCYGKVDITQKEYHRFMSALRQAL